MTSGTFCRILRQVLACGYTLMRQSAELSENFTQFCTKVDSERRLWTCLSPPAVAVQWLFRPRSTRCLDSWEMTSAHFPFSMPNAGSYSGYMLLRQLRRLFGRSSYGFLREGDLGSCVGPPCIRQDGFRRMNFSPFTIAQSSARGHARSSSSELSAHHVASQHVGGRQQRRVDVVGHGSWLVLDEPCHTAH